MALTNVLVVQTKIADRYLRIVKSTWDSSYATGGEALTAADLGFSDLAADLTVIDGGGSPVQAVFDAANAKLIAYGCITSATAIALVEIASAVNLAAFTNLLFVFGKKPVAS